MQKIIGVTEMQRHFRQVFDEVARDHVPYVLTRGSRPEAALIPYEEFLRFQALQEDRILAEFDGFIKRMQERNSRFSDEEVADDVAAVLSEEGCPPAKNRDLPGPEGQ